MIDKVFSTSEIILLAFLFSTVISLVLYLTYTGPQLAETDGSFDWDDAWPYVVIWVGVFMLAFFFQKTVNRLGQRQSDTWLKKFRVENNPVDSLVRAARRVTQQPRRALPFIQMSGLQR